MWLTCVYDRIRDSGPPFFCSIREGGQSVYVHAFVCANALPLTLSTGHLRRSPYYLPCAFGPVSFFSLSRPQISLRSAQKMIVVSQLFCCIQTKALRIRVQLMPTTRQVSSRDWWITARLFAFLPGCRNAAGARAYHPTFFFEYIICTPIWVKWCLFSTHYISDLLVDDPNDPPHCLPRRLGAE